MATQVVSLGHETLVRLVDTAGTVWGTQVFPPSDVERTTALGPPDETPTAVQCRESGHEMPVKFVTTPG